MTTTPEPQPATDLAARLEAVLTERFTELGNPFSEMRRREQGPDGWPASHPVGPRGVAEVLRELLADVPTVLPPVSRAASLRDDIAEALMCWAEGHNDPKYGPIRRPGTVTQNAYGRADAVLGAIGARLGERAAVLREAADFLWNHPRASAIDSDFRAASDVLRRLAAEEQPADDEAAPVEPHPTQADMDHALAVTARFFRGRDADPAEEPEADRIVAYRHPDAPSALFCREHGANWLGLMPLTSEDLPDGGICNRPDCGVDVLIPPQAPAAAAAPAGTEEAR